MDEPRAVVKLEIEGRTYDWVWNEQGYWKATLTQQYWEYREDLDCESLAEVGVTMLEIIEGLHG
jgi:hypothetical protein